MPTRYYPIPRPIEGDFAELISKSRWAPGYTDRRQPFVRLSEPFSYDQKSGGRSIQSPKFGLQYPTPEQIFVTAFSYDQRYGGKSNYPPPPPIVAEQRPVLPYNLAKYPDYERAEKLRWINITSDRPQPETHSVKAIDIAQFLPGPRAIQTYADLYPPAVKKIVAHSPDELPPRNTKIVLGYADLFSPSVERVTAFDYLQAYGAKSVYPPFPPVTVQPYPPETHYISAVEIAQALFRSRVIPAYADLLPPMVKIVIAADQPQKYGALSIYPPTPVTPPVDHPAQVVFVPHYPELGLIAKSRWQPGYKDFGVLPFTKKVTAFGYELQADYIQPDASGRRNLPRWTIGYADFLPPETHKISAAEIAQVLLGTRAYTYLPNLYPPQVEKAVAFDYPQFYGGRRVYPLPADAIPPTGVTPEVHRVTAAEILQALTASKAITTYADNLPPSVKQIVAFELAQLLLGTRAYPYPPDRYPPSVEKITAFDYAQVYGGRRVYPLPADTVIPPGTTPEIHKVIAAELIQALFASKAVTAFADKLPPAITAVAAFDLRQLLLGTRSYPTLRTPDRIPPQTERVTAFELAQYLLGTRAYTYPPDLYPPSVEKIAAIEILQTLLGTRAYPYPPDKYPPFVEKITAFDYPQLYGGRPFYPIRPDTIIPPGTLPYSTRVAAVELLQALFPSKTIPAFADRKPPQVEIVAAFELAQKLLGSRIYPALRSADILPPQVKRVQAIEILQRLLETRTISAYRDLYPPELHSVAAHDPRQLGPTHFYVVVADLLPPEITKVLAHDPTQKTSVPTAYVIRADLKPPGVYKSQAIERVEAFLGVRFKHFGITSVSTTFLTPYEALVGISTLTDVPWEAQSEAGVLTDWELAYESLAYSAGTGTLPYESLTTVDFVAPSVAYEALQGAASATSLAYEALGFLTSTGIIPYESLVDIHSTITAVYEALQGVSLARGVAYDATGAVSSIADLSYEARGFVFGDFGLPYEALQSLSRTGALPWETLVGLALTGVLPWESASELVPPHYLRAAMSSHYYARLLRHYEARMTTHIATELKKL